MGKKKEEKNLLIDMCSAFERAYKAMKKTNVELINKLQANNIDCSVELTEEEKKSIVTAENILNISNSIN